MKQITEQEISDAAKDIASKIIPLSGLESQIHQQLAYDGAQWAISQMQQWAILFASEKIKGALQVAAERARILLERDEPVHHKLEIQSYTYEDGTLFTIHKDSILSLESELIEKLNKEI